MNTNSGAFRINGSEGGSGQVLTSNGPAGGAPSWDFPIKAFQWGIPTVFDFNSATEVSLLNQNFAVSSNCTLMISIQIGLQNVVCVGCVSATGHGYLYVDGVKTGAFYYASQTGFLYQA
jgi:hypothetical protein